MLDVSSDNVLGHSEMKTSDSDDKVDSQLKDVHVGISTINNLRSFYYDDVLDVYKTLPHISAGKVLISEWICPNINTKKSPLLEIFQNNVDKDIYLSKHNSDVALPVVPSHYLINYLDTFRSYDDDESQLASHLQRLDCYPKLFLPDGERKTFRTIQKSQSVPLHCHIRMNMTTGKQEAKVIDPNEQPSDPINQSNPKDISIQLDKDFIEKDDNKDNKDEDKDNNSINIHFANKDNDNDNSLINKLFKDKKYAKKRKSNDQFSINYENKINDEDDEEKEDKVDYKSFIPEFTAKQKLTIQEKGVLEALLNGNKEKSNSKLENIVNEEIEEIEFESILDENILEYISDLVYQIDYGIEFAENHLWKLLKFENPKKRFIIASIIRNSASNNPIAAINCLKSINILIDWVLESCKFNYQQYYNNNTSNDLYELNHHQLNLRKEKLIENKRLELKNRINDDDNGNNKEYTNIEIIELLQKENSDLIQDEYIKSLYDPYCIPLTVNHEILDINKDIKKKLGPNKKLLHRIIFTLGAILRSGTSGYIKLEELNRLYINIEPYYKDELDKLINVVKEVIRPDYLIFDNKLDEIELEKAINLIYGPVGKIAKESLILRKEYLLNQNNNNKNNK